MSSHSVSHVIDLGSRPKRRDLLTLIASAGAAIGLGSIVWPLVDSMPPSADVLAARAPMDIDLSKIEPGQQIVVLWRGAPILIVNRMPDALKTLQTPALISLLADPSSTAHQQPPYAENWHRSTNPVYAVTVGICTHLGCLPGYMPKPDPATPAPNWLGGYFCPCHGSKYDLAARVYKGVPAPLNLPIPPYRFADDKTLRLGENPPGQTFELSSVVQM
jgi:ubiquinol-cytochrome c reductase iron-sulfur subunit